MFFAGQGVESMFWATYKKVSNEHGQAFVEGENDEVGNILTFVRSLRCLSMHLFHSQLAVMLG